MSKQTFATLEPARSERQKRRHYVMEIPVISTLHLPPAERDVIERWARSNRSNILGSELGEDVWSVILYIEGGKDSLPWEGDTDTETDIPPVFCSIIEELANRGFDYVRFDGEVGDEFHDLTKFDDEPGQCAATPPAGSSI